MIRKKYVIYIYMLSVDGTSCSTTESFLARVTGNEVTLTFMF